MHVLCKKKWLVLYFNKLAQIGLVMSKKKRNRAAEVAKKLQRKIAIQEGFYDGRFKEKVVPDKKKEAKKKWARQKDGSEE